MASPQLEFPLIDFLPIEEKVEWLKKAQESDRDLTLRSNKKAFSRINELEKQVKEFKFLLTQLVDLLNKQVD